MFYLRKKLQIEPAAPAMVMAMGIFIIGVLPYFPQIDLKIGAMLAVSLGLIWLIIAGLFIIQGTSFFKKLIKEPIRSFAIGTWIASTAVLLQVLSTYFPTYLIYIKILALLDCILLIGFIVLVIYQFINIHRTEWEYYIDGVILLSTVSIQAIVILVSHLFALPQKILLSFVIIGLIFYLYSIFIIIRRYSWLRWTIADHWSNTNCIIHGALSITGLAFVTIGAFNGALISGFWLFTFLMLCIVEIIEIIRAVHRVKKYGFKHGVFIYHVTQWARNFTFGMFLVFTKTFVQSNHYVIHKGLLKFQELFLTYWIWLVTILLFIQIWLFFIHYHHRFIVNQKKQ